MPECPIHHTPLVCPACQGKATSPECGTRMTLIEDRNGLAFWVCRGCDHQEDE
jgi:primosomal protein N'